MHKFPRWIHFINDTVIPLLGYIFIAIGILQWGKELISIGIGFLLIYWVSQIATWLGYLNRRIDKYFGINRQVQKENLDYMFTRFHQLMQSEDKEPREAKVNVNVAVKKGFDPKETIKQIKKIKTR